MKNQEKLYPFSNSRMHDIEFLRNRLKNTVSDIENMAKNATESDIERLYTKIDGLTDILCADSDGRVYWLTGKQYGMAQEASHWAQAQRQPARYQ